MIYINLKNKLITKEQAEIEFWEIVDTEKTLLFEGKSKIYHKKGN